jgi:transcription initiation factor TFIIB
VLPQKPHRRGAFVVERGVSNLSAFPNACPACGSHFIYFDVERGEVICRSCGAVLEQRNLDLSPEWRAFTQEEKEEMDRSGAPLSDLFYDRGLTTKISYSPKKGDLEQDPDPTLNQRLAAWQDRSAGSSEQRHLKRALTLMRRTGLSLGVPKPILEYASRLYRRVYTEKSLKMRNVESTVAAAIYFSCKSFNFSRSLDEVAQAVNVSKKATGRAYRNLVWVVGPPRHKAVNPQEKETKLCLLRIAEVMGITDASLAVALRILDVAESLKLDRGRLPKSLVAAVLYVSSVLTNQTKTQREIASASGITEVTLRNRYKELIEKIDIRLLV